VFDPDPALNRARVSRMFARLAAVCAVGLLGTALATQEASSQEKPLISDELFKNIQVLKGIPVDEFLDTMGMFAAATGLNCTDCHIPESGGSWARYADDNQLKRTTRGMVVMVNSINKSYFGGRQGITCYSCHNGNRRPRVIPSLAVQYAVDPIIDDPFEITQSVSGAPTADAVLDKYISAVGGAARLATMTSFVAEGTYRGFDDFEMFPFQIFSKTPNQRTTIQHSQYGDITTTYDGRTGWLAAPTENKPTPVMGLTGGNLEGAGVEAELAFPGRIKQLLAGWVVGPLRVIGDREVRILQGKKASGTPVSLYFDEESGLLVRLVRYSAETPVGRVPIQVDYEDYRDVSGIKIPFKWTSTWTDGRTVFELKSVQLNAAIDAARFAKPSPPAR
jgi:Photosynthetic reaction centre cytochrome C subunit